MFPVPARPKPSPSYRQPGRKLQFYLEDNEDRAPDIPLRCGLRAPLRHLAQALDGDDSVQRNFFELSPWRVV